MYVARAIRVSDDNMLDSLDATKQSVMCLGLVGGRFVVTARGHSRPNDAGLPALPVAATCTCARVWS